MNKLHNKLLEKLSFYRRWHNHQNYSHVHELVLAVSIFIAVLGIIISANRFKEENLAFVTVKTPERFSAGRIIKKDSGQIIVGFKEYVKEAEKNKIFTHHGLKEKGAIPQIGIKIVSVPAGVAAEEVINRMKQNVDSVEFAEPDYLLEPSIIPDDPWFLNWQKDKQQIGFLQAWDVSVGRSELVTAVVDTGVNCFHEDLAMNCVSGWNFNDNTADTGDVHGHGTKVAGVIAAMGNNGMGVAGGVWNSKIMPLRVGDSSGLASYSAIARAVVYAADHGVKVVNNSYQSSGSASVKSAARYLNRKGGILVVSAGNSGILSGNRNSSDIITVSAVDSNDNIYAWSNFGEDVDIAAPGCAGATTANNGGYESFCGTSNSAPEVSGAIMLIWSVNPLLAPDEARDIIFRSAKDLGNSGWDQHYGWGRVDIASAVDLAKNPVLKPERRGR